MDHLFIAYEGLLVITGVLTLVLLKIYKYSKSYLNSFLWFYLCFTITILFSFIRSYSMLNIPYTNLYYVYISYGLSTIIDFLIIYFAMKTTHSLIHKKNKKIEKVLSVLLLLSAFIMITPASILYVEQDQTLYFKLFYFISLFVYMTLLFYIIIQLIIHFKKIVERDDKLFSFFLMLLGFFGFIETITTFCFQVNRPYDKLENTSLDMDYSTLPYFILSMYIIVFLIGKIKVTTTVPTRERLLDLNFSPREIDIIMLIIKGFPNQKIADELSISITTVKTHINNIFRKSDVSNRFELAKLLEKI